MWNFLKSNKPESSLRVNLFIITVPISAILFAMAFHLFWLTLNPVVSMWLGPGKIEYKTLEIDWDGIGKFIVLILAGYFTLLYGKKLNKDAEGKMGEGSNPPAG